MAMTIASRVKKNMVRVLSMAFYFFDNDQNQTLRAPATIAASPLIHIGIGWPATSTSICLTRRTMCPIVKMVNNTAAMRRPVRCEFILPLSLVAGRFVYKPSGVSGDSNPYGHGGLECSKPTSN